MQVVDVKMQEIKGTRLLEDVLEQHHMMRQLIDTVLVQAQRTRTGRHQARLADGIPTGKEGDLMSLAHEFFCEV